MFQHGVAMLTDSPQNVDVLVQVLFDFRAGFKQRHVNYACHMQGLVWELKYKRFLQSFQKSMISWTIVSNRRCMRFPRSHPNPRCFTLGLFAILEDFLVALTKPCMPLVAITLNVKSCFSWRILLACGVEDTTKHHARSVMTSVDNGDCTLQHDAAGRESPPVMTSVVCEDHHEHFRLIIKPLSLFDFSSF